MWRKTVFYSVFGEGESGVSTWSAGFVLRETDVD